MKKKKTFRKAISTPLRKTFTSAIARNLKPKPTSEQYAKLTRICSSNVGIRRSRSRVDNPGLLLLSLAEGLAGELLATKKVESYSAAKEIVRSAARTARNSSAEQRKELLLHILDFHDINPGKKIDDFPNWAARNIGEEAISSWPLPRISGILAAL